MYSRCSAAYRALCPFDILKLPSVYCVQQKLREYVDEPGINHEYMSKQRARYTEFKTQVKHQGKKEPLGEGILIFDEVKIIDKVIWNSKSESFIGLAMSEEDFVQIKDLCSKQNDEQEAPQYIIYAQYILQFMWRDLSSDFDIIGPYFSSTRHLSQSFIMECLLETMRVFHANDLIVTCLVCDGAATNLSLIKTTLGQKGVIYIK